MSFSVLNAKIVDHLKVLPFQTFRLSRGGGVHDQILDGNVPSRFQNIPVPYTNSSKMYSRVPNKRGGGENNRGGWKWLDITISGGWNNWGGGGCLEK